jgi:hypothetical protein
MSKLKKRLIVVTAIIINVWVLQKLNLIPSPKDFFKSQPVVIDETPILIKEIKSIAQLITVAAFDEVVVDSVMPDTESKIKKLLNPFSPYPILPAKNKRIVLIARGKVLAGTDLQNLKEQKIQIKKDTVTVILNHAIILDAIINPSDFETFDEQGKWSDEAVRAVKLKARQKIIERAIQHKILEKANNKAKAIMENFLSSSGYKTVNVIIE